MDRLLLKLLIGQTLIFLGSIAWIKLDHRNEIEELRNEFRENQREQREHLLGLFKQHHSKYEILVQMMEKERSERQENDEATKRAIDGLLDINDKLVQHISYLEKDHNATEATQQAKIDRLEQENRELKAKLRREVGSLEDRLRMECHADIAVLEKKANDSHSTMNETLQWHVSNLKNDHKVARTRQQAQIDQLKEDIRDSKAEQREDQRAFGKLRMEWHADIAGLEKKVNNNHQIMNETLHSVVEWFIFETEQSRQRCKNATTTLAEEIQQIKSQEHVVIQNEVIIQNGHQLQESTHRYRNWGAQYGAMVGEIVGGYAQDMVTGLWSTAISLLTKLK